MSPTAMPDIDTAAELKSEVDTLKERLDDLAGQLEGLRSLLVEDEGIEVVEDVMVQLTGPLRAAVAVDDREVVLSGLISKTGMARAVKLTDPIALVIASRGISGLSVKCNVTVNGKTVEKGFVMEKKKEIRVFDIPFSDFNLKAAAPAPV